MLLILLPLVAHSLDPIVFWHGLGDSCCDGIADLGKSVQKWYPTTITHSIRIGRDPEADKKASFFGQINSQVDQVCDQLKQVKGLEHGFNAIGFSQGGLFFRAYVQKCNNPPVLNLLTFGSPHAGVSSIRCANEDALDCKAMQSLVKQGAYWDWIQNKVIPAQYFKDISNLDRYFEKSIFLPQINNEYARNKTHEKNIAALRSMVLIKFDQDHVLQPTESAHFGFYDAENRTKIINLFDQDWFKDGVLGLDKLHNSNKLRFASLPGKHMQFSQDEFKQIIDTYLVPNLLAVGQ